jgi:CheY-like chemotaxis protein
MTRKAVDMQRTYINMIAEYYRRKDDEFDLTMGAFGEPKKNRLDKALGRERGRMIPKRLLVVDDEARIRNAYQRFFSRQGFDVLTAGDAMGAKDLLVREKVDVVFLDINMAEVDGAILFELVRSFHPGVKVIVSSVYSIEEQRERIRDADAYFDKSDSKDALLGMVSALVVRTEGPGGS